MSGSNEEYWFDIDEVAGAALSATEKQNIRDFWETLETPGAEVFENRDDELLRQYREAISDQLDTLPRIQIDVDGISEEQRQHDIFYKVLREPELTVDENRDQLDLFHDRDTGR